MQGLLVDAHDHDAVVDRADAAYLEARIERALLHVFHETYERGLGTVRGLVEDVEAEECDDDRNGVINAAQPLDKAGTAVGDLAEKKYQWVQSSATLQHSAANACKLYTS